MNNDFGREWDDLIDNHSKEVKRIQVNLIRKLIDDVFDYENVSQVIGHLHNEIERLEKDV